MRRKVAQLVKKSKQVPTVFDFVETSPHVFQQVKKVYPSTESVIVADHYQPHGERPYWWSDILSVDNTLKNATEVHTIDHVYTVHPQGFELDIKDMVNK